MKSYDCKLLRRKDRQWAWAELHTKESINSQELYSVLNRMNLFCPGRCAQIFKKVYVFAKFCNYILCIFLNCQRFQVNNGSDNGNKHYLGHCLQISMLQYRSPWGNTCSCNTVWYVMMTSSNGNIFRVTGHLCGEFTGPRWIPHTKASDAEVWCFLGSASE